MTRPRFHRNESLSVPAAAVAILVSLSLGACGGDDDGEDFASAYRDARDVSVPFGEDLQAALEEAPSKSDAQISEEFAALEESAGEAHSAYAELEPPEELSDEVDTVVSGVSGIQDELGAIVSAADSGDAQAAAAASQALVGHIQDVAPATDAINKELGIEEGSE